MIPVSAPRIDGNEALYVLDCIQTGWISSAGRYLQRFETEWAAYCGRKHAIAVSSGTAALELAVASLQIPAGAEVILPSFTIVSCVEAVLRNDLIPVLVDCDPTTFCLDISDVRKKITPRTAAVMPVHIYGHPANMGPLLKLCAEHKLKIIEDAAEGHGAQCLVDGRWRLCGNFGDVSAFSFYANKTVTCGEGGMVLTDDDDIAARLKSLRNLYFGAEERFRHEERGRNYRMTNLSAAVGCAQIERLGEFLARKRSLAERYSAGLRGLPLTLPREEAWARSSFWMYAVSLQDDAACGAREFARRLAAGGVETRPFFRGMHAQPCYQKIGLFKNLSLPATDRASERGLYLPSGPAISDAQIDRVIESVRAAFANVPAEARA